MAPGARSDGGGARTTTVFDPRAAPVASAHAPRDTGASKVVVLAGGTGGAKLARGMLDVVGPDELVVIANTGDDIDIYGAHVSPDPDLVSFWLADLIDERGWGLRGDTFAVMNALRALGVDVWFNLGDRDLAWCLERTRMEEEEGLRPTEALQALTERIGVPATVLPMTDQPVSTWVRTAQRGWRPFQEFMIRDGCQGDIEKVAFRMAGETSPSHEHISCACDEHIVRAGRQTGPSQQTHPHADGEASPSQEVFTALTEARAVIVGPSNPVISIWPILWVTGQALDSISAPVVCVSPVVGGEIVKGPTAVFLTAYSQPVTASGVAAFYEAVRPGLVDGMVADEPVRGLPGLQIDTLMPDGTARASVAEQALSFALSLAR